MRELHECQAEVFRRSEKRIKERKQRRQRILMTCIPLVLCLTIFGAFLFPQLDDLKRAPESSNEHYFSGAMGTETDGGLFAGSVEVSGNGVSNYYTSVENVQGIMRLINGIVAVPETDDADKDENFVVEDSTSTELKGDHKENGYRILVKRSDGSSAEYLLVGSMLIDQATQNEFHMSEDTCKELKDALGIPHK